MSFADVPFNLDVTLCCGQVFRWEKIGEWWYGVVGERVFKVRQVEGRLEFGNIEQDFVERYFGLDVDLQIICRSINKDKYIEKALCDFWGLRLIRQEPIECLVSYICATYKSIPAIKRMLNNMARKFGSKKTLDSFTFYSFPDCQKLAAATEQDLRSCGLGYRAKYVLATAQKICKEGFDLEDLRKLPYLKAKKGLLAFAGVGTKVADCVLLFSLDKSEAFPVDVWVKRVVLKHYAEKLPLGLAQKLLSHEGLSSGDYERLNSFGRSYFGQYAGYAQEYLYHAERVAV